MILSRTHLDLSVTYYCRLDIFLHTQGWEGLFPNTRQEAFPRVVSDHCPVIFESCPFKWGPCPFRFENAWLEDRSFKGYFKYWWKNCRPQGWEGFKFMRMLKAVKENLRGWKHEVFGDSTKLKAELVRGIEELDAKEVGEGLSRALRDERNMLRMRLEETVFRE